jgi:hypothetical protein
MKGSREPHHCPSKVCAHGAKFQASMGRDKVNECTTYGDRAAMLPDTAERGLRVTEERRRAALGLFIKGEHSASPMISNCLGESTVFIFLDHSPKKTFFHRN